MAGSEVEAHAEAVVDGLAGSVTLTGGRWWHRKLTTITLNAEQVEHFARQVRSHSQVENVEVGGINFGFRCCDRPGVYFQGFAQREHFARRLIVTRTGCPDCGHIHV